MAIHDTEEEQLEALKRWWAENNAAVIGGVAAAIIISTGWNFWQTHQRDQASQASTLYEQLLGNAAKNDKQAIEGQAQGLIEQFPASDYANYAALVLAKSKVQQGDLEGAKAILQQQMQEAKSVELRHVARLRLAQLMLATKQYEPGLQLIAEVHPAQSKGFAGSYDELEGDFYVAMDRLDEARAAYQRAATAGYGSPLLQFKLDDIAAPALVAPAAKS